MTTPTARPGREARGSEREDSRFATWRSSWRVAIRMGRRDVRRHRGRSALIVLMVLLPVVVVIGGVVTISTQMVTSAELLPLQMGSGVGMVSVEEDGRVASNQEYYARACQPDCPGDTPAPRAATPVPGWSVGREAASLQTLLGGTVARVTSSDATVSLGSLRQPVTVVGADVAAHPFLVGRATLDSGRWPTTPSEVVVTRVGVGTGLPTSGQLTVAPRPTTVPTTGPTTAPAAPAVPARELTVVGTATAFTSDDQGNVQPADLVTLPDALGRVERAPGSGQGDGGLVGVQYVLDRPQPLSPSEVSALNDHGLRVTDQRLNNGTLLETNDTRGGAFTAYTALAAVGLLLLTSLLAGPAFAVSAARQRRTLALAAANGATTAQVRRTVLGQALVLGVLAALLGGVVGLGGSWVLLRWAAVRWPSIWWGPYDVPPAPVAVVLGSAVVSSVVAALLPARGLGRLDVVRVMRGQEVPARLHRGLPALGAVLLLAGTALMAWGFLSTSDTSQPQAIVAISGGALALVVGALCVIPSALAGLGRLTRGLPVTVRMATRDASRQRGRATPTVAAVMAVSAVLTTALLVTASTARRDQLTYEPQAPPGTAQLYLGDFTLDSDPEGTGGRARLDAILRDVAPALRVASTAQVSTPMPELGYGSGQGGTSPTSSRLVAAVRPGCPLSTAAEVALTPFSVDPTTQVRCSSLSSVVNASGSSMLVADADYLTRALGLDDRERTTLEHGGMLVLAGPGRPSRTVVAGDSSVSADPAEATVTVVDGTVTMVDARLITEAAPSADAGTSATSGPLPNAPVGVPTAVPTAVPAADSTTRVVGSPATVRVPALAIDRSRLAVLRGPGAVMTPATAAAHGWPTTHQQTVAWDPAGPISRNAQGAVQAALGSRLPGATIEVERGYDGGAAGLTALIAVAVAAFLTLVATLIATALSQAESQAFSGTLAAVGATRGTRRRIAGAQAGFLALAGVLLGLVVGLAPGLFTARAATTPHWYDAGLVGQVGPTVVVPWLELLAPLLVVPLAAALVAAVSIRTTPTVTRRLT